MQTTLFYTTDTDPVQADRILRDLETQARRHGKAVRPYCLKRLHSGLTPSEFTMLRTLLDRRLNSSPDFRGACRKRSTPCGK